MIPHEINGGSTGANYRNLYIQHIGRHSYFLGYIMYGTSVLYEFTKQPWWWSVASKLCEDKYCYRLSRSHLEKCLGCLEQKIERLGLVKFWWTSRLGCNVNRLVHIPATRTQVRQVTLVHVAKCHSTISWIMFTYFPMNGFRATVCALTETINTTVPLPDGGKNMDQSKSFHYNSSYLIAKIIEKQYKLREIIIIEITQIVVPVHWCHCPYQATALRLPYGHSLQPASVARSPSCFQSCSSSVSTQITILICNILLIIDYNLTKSQSIHLSKKLCTLAK